LAHVYHPLYPLAIVPAHALGLPWEAAGAAVSVAAGVAAVVFLHAFLRDAFGPPVALVGAVLFAVHPQAIRDGSDINSDGLYVALFLVAVWRTWRALEAPSASSAALGGVLAGLAYLTRPEGLLVVVGGVVVAGLRAARGRLRPLAFVVWAAALLVGSATCVLPYASALRAQTGEWQLTAKKSAAVLSGLASSGTVDAPPPGLEPWRPEAAQSGRALAPADPAARAVAPRPGSEPGPAQASQRRAERSTDNPIQQYLRRARRSARYELLAFLAVGLVASLGRPGPRAIYVGTLFALHAVVLLQLVLQYGYVSRRHWFPAFAITLGYAAIGVTLVGRAILALLPVGRASPGAAAAVGLCLAVAIALAQQREPRQLDERAARSAAEWLAVHRDGRGAVAAHHGRTAYYAGAPWVSLGAALEKRKPLQALEGEGARYLIVDDAEELERLGLARDGPARMLHRVETGGRQAWVFEIAGRDPTER
jgi:hypothetical protein